MSTIIQKAPSHQVLSSLCAASYKACPGKSVEGLDLTQVWCDYSIPGPYPFGICIYNAGSGLINPSWFTEVSWGCVGESPKPSVVTLPFVDVQAARALQNPILICSLKPPGALCTASR